MWFLIKKFNSKNFKKWKRGWSAAVNWGERDVFLKSRMLFEREWFRGKKGKTKQIIEFILFQKKIRRWELVFLSKTNGIRLWKLLFYLWCVLRKAWSENLSFQGSQRLISILLLPQLGIFTVSCLLYYVILSGDICSHGFLTPLKFSPWHQIS